MPKKPTVEKRARVSPAIYKKILLRSVEMDLSVSEVIEDIEAKATKYERLMKKGNVA